VRASRARWCASTKSSSAAGRPGRGPTSPAPTSSSAPGRTATRQPCTLENSLTPAEHRLAELGEHHRLRDTRLYFQHATEPEFRAVIERVLSREVLSFVSGMDTRTDVSSEIFYLRSGN